MFFACPSDNVRALLAPQVPIWSYESAQPNPVQNFPLPMASGIDLLDSHTTELAYVFGHDGAGNPLMGQDRLLSNEVIGYWTRFAASGNPNFALRLAAVIQALGYRPVFWPRYEAAAPRVLSLRAQPTVSGDFAVAHQCALWASLGYPERLLTSVPNP